MKSIGIAAAAGAAALLYALATREAAPSQDLPFTSYTATSKSIELLAALDEGAPSATLGETFGLTSASVTVSAASPLIKGEVLLKILCMSVDPYLRGGIKSINGLTGAANEPCPRVMSGFVAGIVIASNDEAWAVGDRFGAHLPFATVQRAFLGRTVAWKLTGLVGSNDANISYGVGVLGMPGATAYGGLTGVLRPREEKKETILITAAAGAVGSLVGQIAKQVYGATVIGTAGGPGKVHTLLSKYDFDYAIDRKALPDQAEDGTWRARKEALIGELKTAAPHGIDMVFENVGQDHFEAAFESLAPKGRIAVCGQIAAYNDNSATPRMPSINPGRMIYSFQRVEGFVCSPWLSGARGDFLNDMAAWLAQGKLKPTETKVHGLERWPAAFNRLFERTELKQGKMVVMMKDSDWEEEVVRA